jgi:SNF2 family DNA or RNA helicase
MAQELAALGADMVGEEHMSRMRRFLGTYKASRIGKIINDELEQGQYDGVVVLYHHHDTRDKLAALLAGHQVHGFDGSTTSPMRQVEIERFQHAGGVFLAQQGAAGVGITLTRASEIVLVEPSWSPEDNNQAIKRIHRIGQDKPCRARLFAVPDSLDEGLMNALARKSAMVKEVVDADQV